MENFVRVDEWKPKPEDEILTVNGNLVIIPFEKIFKQESVKTINTFIIKKPVYARKLANTIHKETGEESKGICHYINYFIKYYDKDNELVLSYLKLKYLVDNKKKPIKSAKAFKKALYKILITPSLKEKIRKMVEDNYYVKLNSNEKNGVKYPEQLEITEDHAKIMMMISVSMKIMIVPLYHYLTSYNLLKMVVAADFFIDLFYAFSDTIDIYNKLFITVKTRVQRNASVNPAWKQREILGVNPTIFTNKLLQRNIISENMFKYTFEKNIVNFNAVIIDKHLEYFLREEFEHNLIELTNEKDSEGLSGLDKLEMNSFKIDESLLILSEVNIRDTIRKVRKSINVSLSKDEIEFYKDNHKINKLQMELVNYYFVKYFGGFSDLNALKRKQYLKLLILLKKKLQYQGLVFLPQILTGNIVKLNKRTIQNSKFLNKIEGSSFYQSLVHEKFPTLGELGKENLILNLLSTLLNSTFTFVDYDMPDRLGEEIEIKNQDVLSDEFLSFLNQI